MREGFTRFAARIAYLVGSSWAFLIAVIMILAWAASGPLFGFSDTWQLVINTSTTIITFLMVFLIQNTQNRDARAMQLKLDELIRAVGQASDRLIDIEEATDEDLERLERIYRWRAAHLRANAVTPGELVRSAEGNPSGASPPASSTRSRAVTEATTRE
jgi:low affinity Fe/Cu permease